MYDFFVKLLNMSLAASIIILVIVVLRLLLKKAPRNIICFLWVLVALRLILPFSIQSNLSVYNMMPSSAGTQGQIEYFQYNGKTEKPKVEFSVPALVNDNASPDSMTIGEHTSDLYLPPVISIWLAGVCVMLLYAIGSYLYLRKKVGASIPRREGLKMSDDISTPFILSILKPVIYIPSGMDEKTLNHVVAHEKAHIKRRDHWWKPLGYCLLTVYWFNPIIWLAYVLLCRDIEMACDEKVIRDMDKGSVAAYSQALLDCSFPRRRIAACPLAFGEVGVKERVKTVLNYKKPAFWIIIAAIVACAIVAVCFLTNPAANRYYPMTGHSISDLEPNQIVEWIAKLEKLNDAADLNTNSDNFDILLTSDFDIQNAPAIRYYFTEKRQVYCGQLRMFTDENRYFTTKRTKWTEQNRTYKLQTYLEALKYLPQEQIRQLSPNADSYSVMIAGGGSLENNARTISYTSTGVCSSDGWQIHLLVQPLHGGNGDGSEEIHLFYDATAVNYPVLTRRFDALHGDEIDFESMEVGDIVYVGDIAIQKAPDDDDGPSGPVTRSTTEGFEVKSFGGNTSVDNVLNLNSTYRYFYIFIKNTGSNTISVTIGNNSSTQSNNFHEIPTGNYYIWSTNQWAAQSHDVSFSSINGMYGSAKAMLSVLPFDGSSASIGALREKYPEYFDLPTAEGLEVYVWQMAQYSYSFGVLSGTNRNKAPEELWNLKRVSAKEMKAILSTYDIDEQNIYIHPWQNPISSYIPEYWVTREGEDQCSVEARRQAYVDNIRSMLFD